MNLKMIKSMVYKPKEYAINEDVEDYTKEIGVYHIWKYYMDMRETDSFDTFVLLDEEFKASEPEQMEELQKYINKFIQVLKIEYNVELYDSNIKATFEHQVKNRILKISVKDNV